MGLLIPLCSMVTISTLVAYNLAAWFANEANDRELLNAAHAVAARLSEDSRGIVADLPKAVQAVLRHNDMDKFFYQVLNDEQVRLAGDAVLPMPVTSTHSDAPRFRYAKVNGEEVRMARIRVPLHGLNNRIVIVQVARTLHARHELIHKIFLSIVIPQIMLIGLSLVTVWLNIRSGLKPLRTLSQDIQKRSQHDLTPIDQSTAPAEVVPLIVALNTLLSRLDSHISAQQRFISNAAHQLRTPVAGLKAYIEYGRRVNNGKIKDVLEQLDQGTDRISEMVSRLLVLARAREQGQKIPVELNSATSQVTAMLMPEAASRNIHLEFEPAPDKTIVSGDQNELQDMITNLVVNGIRYTPEGGRVVVRVEHGPPAQITVEDNGPGIPPEERTRVFERFYRLLGTRVPGSGLGLSIVAEIAERHNAVVELEEPAGGKGTIARISFPANGGVTESAN
jgi:two-component system, OmpR family, sensor histidine kinase TctE